MKSSSLSRTSNNTSHRVEAEVATCRGVTMAAAEAEVGEVIGVEVEAEAVADAEQLMSQRRG